MRWVLPKRLTIQTGDRILHWSEPRASTWRYIACRMLDSIADVLIDIKRPRRMWADLWLAAAFPG
jgi:hypothetical protein